MRKTILLSAVTVLVVMLAVPAGAISNGEFDSENRYPMVGVVVLEVEFGGVVERGTQCSGVLVAPKVFLTGGHCTYNAVNIWQYRRAWVNFSRDVTDAPGDPLAGDGPVVEVAQMSWHPLYPEYPPYPWVLKYDLGVMTLRKPVKLKTYATLPPAGLFDQMQADGSIAGQVFTPVGYGCSSAWPAPSGPMPWRLECLTDRMIGSQTYLGLTPYWVRVSANYPSTGSSGTGPGDSGAPYFLGESYTLAGVYSNEGDGAGVADDLIGRLDTPINRDWVMGFIGG